jgi:hypothetical protein
MTRSSEVFLLDLDVPYGELSTMLVQPSDLLEEPILLFVDEFDDQHVYNWGDQQFERVMITWPTKQP